MNQSNSQCVRAQVALQFCHHVVENLLGQHVAHGPHLPRVRQNGWIYTANEVQMDMTSNFEYPAELVTVTHQHPD